MQLAVINNIIEIGRRFKNYGPMDDLKIKECSLVHPIF
jgi:hypothetical protein